MKTEYTAREIYLTPGQIKKLSAAIAKRNSVSLMISPKAGKVMLTQNQINRLDQGKPFILRLSVSQVKFMAKPGGFFGLSVIFPNILPVLGTLWLAAASGAISGATNKAISGDGIKQILYNNK